MDGAEGEEVGVDDADQETEAEAEEAKGWGVVDNEGGIVGVIVVGGNGAEADEDGVEGIVGGRGSISAGFAVAVAAALAAAAAAAAASCCWAGCR